MRLKLKKDRGELNVISYMLWLVATIILIFYGVITYNLTYFRRNQIEDSVTVSNLSTLVIDKPAYYNSITELLPYITQEEVKKEAALYINPDTAYSTFKQCFKTNLKLIDVADGSWNMQTTDDIASIKIDCMIIYNVVPYIEAGAVKHKVQIYTYQQNGLISVDEVTSGNVQAPNGKWIMRNSVKESESCSYVNVKFQIKTIFNNYSEQSHDSVVELRRN